MLTQRSMQRWTPMRNPKCARLMLATTLLPLVACLSFLGCDSGAVRTAAESADVVLLGDHIHTVDSRNSGATAVALRGAEIVAVGARSDVEALIGEATRVVVLGDRGRTQFFAPQGKQVSSVRYSLHAIAK